MLVFAMHKVRFTQLYGPSKFALIQIDRFWNSSRSLNHWNISNPKQERSWKWFHARACLSLIRVMIGDGDLSKIEILFDPFRSYLIAYFKNINQVCYHSILIKNSISIEDQKWYNIQFVSYLKSIHNLLQFIRKHKISVISSMSRENDNIDLYVSWQVYI